MTVRLAGDERGDPQDRDQNERVSMREREIPRDPAREDCPACTHLPNLTTTTHRTSPRNTQIPEFIPLEIREKLYQIVKKSKDPKRSLAYMQGKLEILLGRNHLDEIPAPSSESSRSSVSGRSPEPAIPPPSPTAWKPACVSPLFIPLTSAGLLHDFRHPLQSGNSSPLDASEDLPERAYDHALEDFSQTDFDLLNLRHSNTRGINRFYAGSNHRYKFPFSQPTNTPAPCILTTILQSTPYPLATISGSWASFTMEDNYAGGSGLALPGAAMSPAPGTASRNATTAGAIIINTNPVEEASAAAFDRRKGKEKIDDTSTDKEKRIALFPA